MGKRWARKRKNNRSVGKRLTILIISMIVTISGAMLIIGYSRFKDSAEQYYFRTGEATAGIVALLVDPSSLDIYLKTRAIDEKYDDTMLMLRKAQIECGAKTLYVFTVADEGIHYIYDTDVSDMLSELGDFDPFVYTDEDTGEVRRLYPEATEQQLRKGGQVDTIMGVTQYGWTMTVNKPLYGVDGICKGYVGIDFDVNQMMSEREEYLWHLVTISLAITMFLAAFYLHAIRKIIIDPIDIIAKAVNSLESGESIGESEILSMEINTKDEFQSLAEALKSMVLKIQEYITNLNIATVKSETDALTSLCNRGAFEQRVSAILRLRPEKDQIDAFMMIDVDFFKSVNDNYGHAAGDVVLSGCAQALRRVIREADVVGRLGGDEFAVFCKSIGSVATAEEKARQIRGEWLKVIPPGGERGVTASIGISLTPRNGRTYQELFNKADEALYKVKEGGRDAFALASVDSASV
ncbi:hypothetical protein AGMMS49957_16740 [Synergistales bacterium]|nr:hypothetical protein AGMMS49957_16740 [Synergistales bacterium]